jgi:outer membrane protein insertion porin family
MVSKWLIFFIVTSISFAAHCQVIESISFTGIKKTKPDFLERFIVSSVGEPLDSAILEADKVRLTYLEPISSARFEVAILNGKTKVVFSCTEFYSILPIFSFGGINENFWLQAGATDVNLQGSNEKLLLYYQYYDRHSLIIDYQKPWIGESDWGYGLNFTRWGTVEPLYFENGNAQYNYDNSSLGANLYYHVNYTDRLIFNATIFEERYEKREVPGLEGAPEIANLRKSLFKLIFNRNRVKSNFFNQDGYSFQLNTEAVFPLDHQAKNFYIGFAELRFFKTIGKTNNPIGNLAQRLKFGLSSNENSPFAPFVLDSYVNIRGVGNRVDRGTGMIVWNSEYRHTLWNAKLISAQLVAFSDLGSWRNPGGNLNDFVQSRNIQWFAGGGLRLILQPVYNAVLRFDFGKDLLHKEMYGFVLGVGQYF